MKKCPPYIYANLVINVKRSVAELASRADFGSEIILSPENEGFKVLYSKKASRITNISCLGVETANRSRGDSHKNWDNLMFLT